MENFNMKPDTLCVHAGTISDKQFGGINSPIYTSSAFHFLDQDESRYPRYFNIPNQRALVEKLCALEQGENGLVLSSGMAAISAVMTGILAPGDHVLIQDRLYGGTHHFVTSQLEKLAIGYTLVEGWTTDAYQEAIQKQSKMIFFETPANPLLDMLDVTDLATLAQEKGLISVIDNTFATPLNMNPITLGVDIVIHSGTKYLSGHSDICFGALITSEKIYQKLLPVVVNYGPSLNANTCYDIERSLKTLALRVRQQNDNAMSLAEMLSDQKGVERVFYPGLKNHPGHEIAVEQMNGFGGMLSFTLTEGGKSAPDFCRNLKLIKPVMSLGGVETTITIPALTSHSKMTSQQREKAGIRENLLRLSVGIENKQDLITDLRQAF